MALQVVLNILFHNRVLLSLNVVSGTPRMSGMRTHNVSRGGCRGGRPPKIGKNMIFWRKIVIFHTKYPNNFSASLRSVQFFSSAPPSNLKSWIRPWSVAISTDWIDSYNYHYDHDHPGPTSEL